MFLKKVIWIATSIIIAGTAVHAQKISRQIPVDSDFQDTAVTLSGQPDLYKMKVKLIVVGGKLEFCGIGSFKSLQYRDGVMRGLRTTKLRVNGNVVLSGINYFSRVNRSNQMASSKANCRATGVPAPSRIDSIEFDWGKFY